jgi:hypothetical protein
MAQRRLTTPVLQKTQWWCKCEKDQKNPALEMGIRIERPTGWGKPEDLP